MTQPPHGPAPRGGTALSGGFVLSGGSALTGSSVLSGEPGISVSAGEPELTDGLRVLAIEAGEPAGELRELVLRRAGRVRRRRFAVAGVLVVALVAIPGVALAVTKPWQSGDRLIVGSTPTAQASASLSSVNPSASTPVGAEASSVPSSRSDTGLAPGAVAPSHSRSAAPRAVVPAPARLRVTVVASDLTPQVGQVVSFRLRWTDGNGRPGGTLASWGNGQVGGSGVSVHRCSANPSPGSGSTVLNHSWVAAGSYTVELGVTTYDCTGALETRTVTLRVTVTGAAVTPPSSSPGADPPPGVA